jgi:heme/copper-type cytochrome/quinol oxidase subunit 2
VATRVLAALAVLCTVEAGLVYLAVRYVQDQNDEIFEHVPPTLIAWLTAAGGVLIVLVLVAGVMALRNPYPDE